MDSTHPSKQKETKQRTSKTITVLTGCAGLMLPFIAWTPAYGQQTPTIKHLDQKITAQSQVINLNNLQQVNTLNTGRFENGGKINLSPKSANLSNLVNKALLLRNNPSLGSVISEKASIANLRSGVAIKTLLTYQLNPTACKSAQRNARLKRNGLSCFRPANATTSATKGKQFSNQRKNRNKADYADQARSELAALLKQTRSEIAKTGRKDLLNLSDEQLTSEILNSAKTTEEETIFIPRNFIVNNNLQPVFNQRIKLLESLNNHQAPPPPQSQNIDIEKLEFLTGFTLGKDFEWRKRFSTCIGLGDRCRTYYIEPYARFGYGLGVRFPMRASNLNFDYEPNSNQNTAKVSVKLEGFDAGTNSYQNLFRASGLQVNNTENYPIYSGKELIAEFEARAGLKYKVPVRGTRDWSTGTSIDFTDYLDGDLAGGHVSPRGQGESLDSTIWAPIDLLGGSGNFGLAGVRVNPGAKISLEINEMELKIKDYNNQRETLIKPSRRTNDYNVLVANNLSTFSLKEPSSTAKFNVTPGLRGVAWVDLYLWERDYPVEVFFPQYSVTVPSKGISFGCHQGTACEHKFTISTTSGQQETERTISSVAESDITAPRSPRWGNWGDKTSEEKCTDGNFIYAFRQRVEARQGNGDDTALNSVEFACARANLRRRNSRTIENRPDQKIDHLAFNKAGPWGTWSDWVFCPENTFLVGFQLKVEPRQGDGDDTGANGFRGYCSRRNTTARYKSSSVQISGSNNGPWGRWSKRRFVSKDFYALNAAQLLIEGPQDRGDDTAMNDIFFKANEIPE